MKSKKIPGILAILFLFIGILDMPYGYYEFLRIAITVISIYFVFIFYKKDKTLLMWIFILIAVLFNPLFVIHLNKELWKYIDIGSALLFSYILLSKK
jgi:hypothetical protein